MTVEEIIQIAELNKIQEIRVLYVEGIHSAKDLILDGPSGTIKVIFKNEISRHPPYQTVTVTKNHVEAAFGFAMVTGQETKHRLKYLLRELGFDQ